MKTQSPSVIAIVLAAGRSARMGRCKALLDIGGKPMIRHILDPLRLAGITRCVVVTGHDADLVQSAAGDVTCVFNSRYEQGMISSVKAGIAAVKDRCGAIIIALGDHPLVQASTVQLLMEQCCLHPNKIALPRYDGKAGHPVLIPAKLADSILKLPPEATLKTWMQQRRDQTQFVDVNDPGIRVDVDTPEDYQSALQLFSKISSGPAKGTERELCPANN